MIVDNFTSPGNLAVAALKKLIKDFSSDLGTM
jgi:hypothetical protein